MEGGGAEEEVGVVEPGAAAAGSAGVAADAAAAGVRFVAEV